MNVEAAFRKGGALRDTLVYGVKEPLKKCLSHKATVSHAFALYKVYRHISEFPEPTIENTSDPNTHELIQFGDEFFQRIRIGSDEVAVLKTIIRFIILMRYDEPYKQFQDWWADRIRQDPKWRPLSKSEPDRKIWMRD